MKAVSYYIVLPLIYLLSILPFPVLYSISYFCYFLIYNVVGYRKKVVIQNLKNSFPTKSEKEIQKLCRDYYLYLCDLTLETFKTLTISKESMLKHCTITAESVNLFDDLAGENKSVILVMGHLGNWEWGGNSFSMIAKHQLFVIYHPITNKYFDSLMYRMRTRFGTRLIPMNNVYKEMLRNKNSLNATAFIADQTPSSVNAYWTNFLNQDTPVFRGAETLARKLNVPVIYISVQKIKRGYYTMVAKKLTDSPSTMKEGELTELHTRILEHDIIAHPETWIWSHKRWKHKRKIVP